MFVVANPKADQAISGFLPCRSESAAKKATPQKVKNLSIASTFPLSLMDWGLGVLVPGPSTISRIIKGTFNKLKASDKKYNQLCKMAQAIGGRLLLAAAAALAPPPLGGERAFSCCKSGAVSSERIVPSWKNSVLLIRGCVRVEYDSGGLIACVC